jgi:hypothetical protein
MYTLFYAPGSAAIAPHAVLEEIDALHKLVKVDLKGGEHRQQALHRPGESAAGGDAHDSRAGIDGAGEGVDGNVIARSAATKQSRTRPY